jgi:hypothetical protein
MVPKGRKAMDCNGAAVGALFEAQRVHHPPEAEERLL